MAAVTVEELVRAVGIDEAKLNERCTQDCLATISTSVGFDWQLAAPHLGLSGTDVDDIEQEGKKEQEKRRKTLEKWIRKYAFKATYRMLVEAFLKISRADQAEEVCRLLISKSGELVYIACQILASYPGVQGGEEERLVTTVCACV